MIWLISILFILLGLGCLFLVIMQLPGTWVMLVLGLGAQLLMEHVIGGDHPFYWGWWALGIGLVLAIIGEVVEGLAGAAGTKAGGGTKRGMVGAFIGGIGGAIGGSFLIPIPILGTLLGSIIGTFIGAVIGETTGEKAKDVGDSIKPAMGASLGRILGTTAKMFCGIVVWSVVSGGFFFIAIGKGSVPVGDAKNLLQSRLAIGHLAQSVLTQRSHALFTTEIPELRDGRAPGDPVTKHIAHFQHFIDAQSS